MNSIRSRRLVGATAIAALAALVLAPSLPAIAGEAPEESAVVVEGDLNFVKFDADVAAEYGYDIRVIDGFEWSVPVSNASGDTTGGVQGNAVIEGGVQARNTVEGLCGRSSLYYNDNFNNSFATSYRIFASHGRPIGHVWRVASRTSSNLYSWNLDGLPTWGGEGWSATRSLSSEVGSPISVEVTTGVVTTNTGSVCSTGNPYDTP